MSAVPTKEPDDLFEQVAKILGLPEAQIRDAVMYQYKYTFDYFSEPQRPAIRLPELGTFRLTRHGVYRKFHKNLRRIRKGIATKHDRDSLKQMLRIRHLPRMYTKYLEGMTEALRTYQRRKKNESNNSQTPPPDTTPQLVGSSDPTGQVLVPSD